ncbi:ABC transporter substrate-binding protein [Draconibacterium sediminis]|uniref:ABC transporter substrate-binding protein n=1 Tax=Draconibacterium sediminis TaxID=1544798 RepID=UPI0026F20153|nr:ABC transporter substrate-binding protein [Draconibacterium sediminis]
MDITRETNITSLLEQYPEYEEFIYSFLGSVTNETSIEKLATENNVSCKALLSGLERYIKRIEQNPCDYTQMRNQLVKPGMVNIAGYTNFLLQDAMFNELTNFAEENNIPLNINLFPKHDKKQFQNYLAVCNSADDLPDMFIGKGFSSLTTSRFFDKFINTGLFNHPVEGIEIGKIFQDAGISDSMQAYHTFGVEEAVMVYDKSINPLLPVPNSWKDILSDTYCESLTQQGKPGQDHFGFIMMLYLYHEFGETGIARFASNVKSKQHFTHTIKNIGRKSDVVAPVNIMHSFASRFIRSDARDTVEVVKTPEGNPAVCQFFLLKSDAPKEAERMAKHLYSESVQSLLEKCGIHPIASSNALTFRWIGWDTLRNLPLPYLKDHLAEIAFNHYKKA